MIRLVVRQLSGGVLRQLTVSALSSVGELAELVAKECCFDPLGFLPQLLYNDTGLGSWGTQTKLVEAGLGDGAELTALRGARLRGEFGRFVYDPDGESGDEYMACTFDLDGGVIKSSTMFDRKELRCTYELLPGRSEFDAELEITCVDNRYQHDIGKQFKSKIRVLQENLHERQLLLEGYPTLCDPVVHDGSDGVDPYRIERVARLFC